MTLRERDRVRECFANRLRGGTVADADRYRRMPSTIVRIDWIRADGREPDRGFDRLPGVISCENDSFAVGFELATGKIERKVRHLAIPPPRTEVSSSRCYQFSGQVDQNFSTDRREIRDQERHKELARKIGQRRNNIGEGVAIEQVEPATGVIGVVVEMLDGRHHFCPELAPLSHNCRRRTIPFGSGHTRQLQRLARRTATNTSPRCRSASVPPLSCLHLCLSSREARLVPWQDLHWSSSTLPRRQTPRPDTLS